MYIDTVVFQENLLPSSYIRKVRRVLDALLHHLDLFLLVLK